LTDVVCGWCRDKENKMGNLMIISDGTAVGTKIKVGDDFMSGITRVEISPITQNGLVRATITVDAVALRLAVKGADIECTDIVTATKIREALLRFGDEEGKPHNAEVTGS
jgi:hypothetical protein